jgi:hypothetical protein
MIETCTHTNIAICDGCNTSCTSLSQRCPEDTSSKIPGLQLCQDHSVTTVVLTVVNRSERVVFHEFESLEGFDDPLIH